jgi:hypothetical protein
MMSAASDIVETELELVERWRTAKLFEAGFTGEDAIELAARLDIDLHDALALVERGCPPEVATRILR